ncbi:MULTISPECIES: hypothetical protein [unclassified Curtobacterium]|jgi:hypothetical protein|uniref:hypothetical protein n=1 Tax=unclassified Curtobacterium TaxID=257496 RepID=UPI000DA7EA72|nr:MULTISPECIES: hypothetical protein [unclassified Curtobacterium]PZE58771.1 hypothetical protein DEJ04_09135 [Curtobacterium sp. MCLR17_044]PZF12246.1 hypothetical protein DEI98_04510 [Curtobacterium sp. MCLR17_034]PZF25641.1 hypothetical protein DEJ05_11530 [Curtobacterium sp. MCLR17_045]PZF42709.1 hypothetical protein DEJ07_06190 [Curtobacterium sp. MCLR17_053]PZF54182.1 hypothetical protein DEJ06_00005 [Curtobacterium sp. MCLR17_051]
MLLASRPIAAFAVVGALSLLLAGCSGGGDDATPSPSASVSRTPSATPTDDDSATSVPTDAASTPTDGGSDDGDGDDAGASDDDTPGAFPGSGATNQPDTDPSEYPATSVVTFAGWDTGSKTLQAGGLVSGTTDTSGKCTFTATKDGVTRTATSTAQASASSVNCAQVSFPAAKVSSGTWSVTLTYAVGSASTTSDPLTAEVP